MQPIKPRRPDLPVLRRLVSENFRRFAPQYAVALALMAIVAVTTGISAWLMKDLINKVFVDRDPWYMWVICGAVVALYTLKGAASYGQEVLLARVGNNIVATMQRRIFDTMLRQDLAFFQRHASSELITRLTQNAQAASVTLNLVATSLGRDLFTLASLLAVMLSQDALLTAIALIGMPVLFLALSRLLKLVRKLFSREVASLASIVATMQETVHGIRVIKAFRLEDTMRARMEDSVSSVERLANRMARVQAGTVPLIDTLGGVAVASVIFYGGWRVIYTGATPGEFFAFITALLMATDPARRLARLNLTLAAASVGVRMLYEMIDSRPVVVDPPDAAPLAVAGGEVRFHGVSFGYDPAAPVLHDVDLVAEAGRTTALVGLSGSGKSTVFNLVLRFWTPQAGRVDIDGVDLAGVTAASLYDQVALVSQDVFLFDGTIAENILRGRPGASEAEMIEAARAASAHDFITRLPNGYETRVGEFGGQLSGGQRQRVSIARAFLKNAPILLLDEPTSALDAESDAAIQKALQVLMKNRTTLIIAHRLATVAAADRIYVLDHGRVAEQGAHAELLRRDGLYARLYQLQFGSAA
ncbi:ABC transporter ATP-binding protein/permease [Alsobacter sp. SYSU M60028]|uniref:ABC transporter ATP-binding protein/permease n=1 Tax=Alsobacter ponti TaxID=2962936 RepID=A0ABT1L6B9_9HYPH|nr:ABC transporter ATP-binding protein [Alsobacter ponti]MCP8936931.1 ABC transporter ATP-binding protein/permease [Alsobacter ponti]